MPNASSPLPIIKVCGLTRFADVGLALRLGADYAGVIVDIPRSPRSLPAPLAARLLYAAQGRGVIVSEYPETERLTQLAEMCRPAAIQLHGGQGPDFVAALTAALPEAVLEFPPEVWGVLSMPADPAEARDALPGLAALAQEFVAAGAAKLVLDSNVAGQSGGTGVCVNWHLAAELVAHSPAPVLIAGGITPENALEAIRITGAAGVDVSSGVEARPGVKSARRIHELMEVLGSPGAFSHRAHEATGGSDRPL